MITIRSLFEESLTASWIERYSHWAASFSFSSDELRRPLRGQLLQRDARAQREALLLRRPQRLREQLQRLRAALADADDAHLAGPLAADRARQAARLRHLAAGGRLHRRVGARVRPVRGALEVGEGERGQRRRTIATTTRPRQHFPHRSPLFGSLRSTRVIHNRNRSTGYAPAGGDGLRLARRRIGIRGQRRRTAARREGLPGRDRRVRAPLRGRRLRRVGVADAPLLLDAEARHAGDLPADRLQGRLHLLGERRRRRQPRVREHALPRPAGVLRQPPVGGAGGVGSRARSALRHRRADARRRRVRGDDRGRPAAEGVRRGDRRRRDLQADPGRDLLRTGRRAGR